MDQEHADRFASLMRSAFEEASVSEEAIAALEESMTNDPGDRHVLAAVAGGAEAIITFNLEHFPPAACEPFGVEPHASRRVSPGDVDALERAGVGEFAAALRAAVD
jgi:hypothetical protein